jgi:hypothetical protein
MNEWRRVLGQHPGNIEARLGQARAAAKAGDRASAAEEYLRIRQIVPDQPEARRGLAPPGALPEHLAAERRGAISEISRIFLRFR